MMVDYVRQITSKKSREYGKYKSFEHLLFLFSYECGNVLGTFYSYRLCAKRFSFLFSFFERVLLVG